MPITVSIVEDDCEARKVLVDWVRAEADFRLGSDHGSAESALPVLPREAPAIVLMDINLPGLNGVECVRQLKVLLPETQFVMLTVYEDAEHIFNALAAGATGYLLKHTPRAELLAALREVRAGGSPMASNIARRVVQSFRTPPPALAPPPATELSGREQEVLELLAGGYLYKEIAEQLNISVATVNTYIRRIYEKLQVRSRGQAVARFNRFSAPPGRFTPAPGTPPGCH